MQLNTRETAALMGVSEKTIYRWVHRTKLPAFRIHGQYRFSQTEVLEWATAHRVNVPEHSLCNLGEHPTTMPSFAEALRAGGIHYRLDGADKASVLQEAVTVLPLPEEVDRPLLLRLMLARERLASTGIGNGVAIPHPRSPIVLFVQRPMIALCFLEQAVEYGALDGKPVHAIFVIISPTIATHLSLLSRLAFALRQPAFSEAIYRQGTREEIIDVAVQIDNAVAQHAENSSTEEGAKK